MQIQTRLTDAKSHKQISMLERTTTQVYHYARHYNIREERNTQTSRNVEQGNIVRALQRERLAINQDARIFAQVGNILASKQRHYYANLRLPILNLLNKCIFSFAS